MLLLLILWSNARRQSDGQVEQQHNVVGRGKEAKAKAVAAPAAPAAVWFIIPAPSAANDFRSLENS